MTETDKLRRMLDERGVEHEDDEDVTRFFGPDGFEVVMQGDIDGKLDCLTPLYLTPEQAIAATLGNEGVGRSNDGVAEMEAGTCHNVGRHCFTCSECGHTTNEPHHMFNRNDPNVMPNFCPNCGRKVVDDGMQRHDPMPIGERIVRCRDCRYYDEIIHACDHPCVTPLRSGCPENWIFTCFDNDFCCWGKRKEVDDA